MLLYETENIYYIYIFASIPNCCLNISFPEQKLIQNGSTAKFPSRKFFMIYNPSNNTWKHTSAWRREWIIGKQRVNSGDKPSGNSNIPLFLLFWINTLYNLLTLGMGGLYSLLLSHWKNVANTIGYHSYYCYICCRRLHLSSRPETRSHGSLLLPNQQQSGNAGEVYVVRDLKWPLKAKDDFQQEITTLSSSATRKLILPTTWGTLEAFISLVKPLMRP